MLWKLPDAEAVPEDYFWNMEFLWVRPLIIEIGNYVPRIVFQSFFLCMVYDYDFFHWLNFYKCMLDLEYYHEAKVFVFCALVYNPIMLFLQQNKLVSLLSGTKNRSNLLYLV